MSYVNSFKKFNKDADKKIQEQDQSGGLDMMNVPPEFQSEMDAINSEKEYIANQEEDLAIRKKNLLNKTQDLQKKIADKAKQAQTNVAAQSGTAQPTQPTNQPQA